ncbi:MAG: Type II secretion system protein F [Planctomycetes bacterium ADurb.Bin401]|nr:MAG: Type II secretion system protein F [Planctomycetes bacterium ADurb.Bin401]
MATYEYTARDETGRIFKGIYDDISSINALTEEFAKIGYKLLKVKRRTKFNSKSLNIKRSEIIPFTYKLAGMCGAGLSIVQSLDTLEKQTDNESLKFIISDVKKSITVGSSLTDAFNKYRAIFSDFFLGMVEAGESSGKLPESLEISASYMEKQNDLRNRLKNAFTYPLIVMIMCSIIVSALVIFVVPVFSKIYGQLGVSLPGPTQLLIVLSNIFRHYWLYLIILVCLLLYLFQNLRKNKYVKSKWDHFKFSMPVLGRLNRLAAAASFVRSFSLLITTGVPIIKAIQVAGVAANNEKVSYISQDMQKSIQSGKNLSESLESHNIFPPLIIQLAGAGEQSGQLTQMLNKGVDFLEKDIDRIINSLLVKLEPALTLGMGIIIGLILMAVYLPMFDYMSHLK